MLVGVTGGTGFIGRLLVESHLADGDMVRMLTRSRTVARIPEGAIPFYGDLSFPYTDLLPFVNGLDVLYHCAAEIRCKEKMSQTNIEGTRHLIKASSRRVNRWVQLSSVGAYGLNPAGIVTEQSPIRPMGLYERTKTDSDHLVLDASKNGCFVATFLRPSTVLGVGMTGQSVLQMIGLINRGLFFFVGNPGTSANYIHVYNVIHALRLCAIKPEAEGQTFIINDYRTFENFIGTISQLLGRARPSLRIPELLVRSIVKPFERIPNFPLNTHRINILTNRTVYSTEKIAFLLGYKHQKSIESGLEEIVKYWRKCQ